MPYSDRSALHRAAVLAPPAVVLIFAGLLLDGIQRRRDSTERVQQTQELVAELHAVNVRLLDAETSQRGFIITGEDEYLRPYADARSDIGAGLANARRLTGGYPGQSARLNALELRITQRLDILERVLAVRREQGPEAGREALLSGGGRATMDEIRSVIAAIGAVEQARLASYQAAQDRALRRLLLTLIPGSLVVIAVAALTNRIFRRQAEQLGRLNVELGESNSLLQNQAVELEMQTQELHAQALYLEDTTAELEATNEDLQQQRVAAEVLAEEVTNANDELQQLNAALEERTNDAEKANRSKAEFLAAMSHELRTPLNAIIGYIDLIDLGVYGPITEGQAGSLARVKRNAQHLLVLINDILQFAKIQSGRIELRSDPVVLGELLSEVDAVMVPLVDAKGISFERHNGQDEVAVLGDHDRIRQVLLNLLSNAVKYTGSGGRVIVHTDVDGELVSIRVRDTGAGIPPELQARIFDPFIQLTRGAGGELNDGVGLGLSISRELAQAMSGELHVDSAEGAGSTFTLTLPRGDLPLPHSDGARPILA
jgi:signal transduction histidine kinase